MAAARRTGRPRHRSPPETHEAPPGTAGGASWKCGCQAAELLLDAVVELLLDVVEEELDDVLSEPLDDEEDELDAEDAGLLLDEEPRLSFR